LATARNEPLCDGPLAVELALRAGRFLEAVATQEAAIQSLTEDADERAAWEERLRLYRKGTGFTD
jgi:hypothetical protein